MPPPAHAFGADFHDGPRFHRVLFTAALFIWGIIASSRAFRPLHDKTRNEAWLLLPASALEKMLARLLAVTVGLVAWLLVFSTVVSVVVESLNLLLVGKRHAFFDPFDPIVWKAHIHLPCLSVAVLPRGSVVPTGALHQDHFCDHVRNHRIGGIGRDHRFESPSPIFPVHVSLHVRNLVHVLVTESDRYTGVANAALIAVMVLLPLACWCIAWMRVAETQVSDGVLASRKASICKSRIRFGKRILRGEWKTGERIPSIRELAVELGVNPNTVTKSYQKLLERELISNQRGRGYFVSEHAGPSVR